MPKQQVPKPMHIPDATLLPTQSEMVDFFTFKLRQALQTSHAQYPGDEVIQRIAQEQAEKAHSDLSNGRDTVLTRTLYPAPPDSEKLIETIQRMVIEKLQHQSGRQPSPEAVEIFSKMMANRAQREMRDGKNSGQGRSGIERYLKDRKLTESRE